MVGRKKDFLSWEIKYSLQTALLVPAERAAEGTGSLTFSPVLQVLLLSLLNLLT